MIEAIFFVGGGEVFSIDVKACGMLKFASITIYAKKKSNVIKE